MTLISLILALVLEQARALPAGNPVHALFRRLAQRVDRGLNAGQYRHGVAAWCVAVLPAVLATLFVSLWLAHHAPVLLVVWNVLVLYLTMGFRQFSHPYTLILECLRGGDVAAAREHLARWRGRGAGELEAEDVARLAIERGLTGAHRHVFAVVAWFVVAGACGAVLYRQAAWLRESWGMRDAPGESEFGRFAARAFEWIDWAPRRLTALAFAVVGDFEDAIYCWRTQARAWPDPAQGTVLAAGAGALGVRLGSTVSGDEAHVRPEIGTGDAPDAELMTSAIGLVWRALVVWLFVVLLVTVASWVG